MPQLQKQLDENRENLLKQREEFVEQAETALKRKIEQSEALESRIDVLGKQVDAKKSQLDKVNQDIRAARVNYANDTQVITKKKTSLETEVASEQTKYNNLVVKAEKLAEGIKTLQSEKEEVSKEVREANSYLVEQEDVVKKAIAEWNAQLTEFASQTSDAEEEKKSILADIYRLTEEKKALAAEIVEQRNTLHKLEQTELSQRAGSVRRLNELKGQTTAAEARLSVVTSKHVAAEKGFGIREKSLDLREKALNEREAKLNQKERFIQSRLSMV